jgi:hypothetical protein
MKAQILRCKCNVDSFLAQIQSIGVAGSDFGAGLSSYQLGQFLGVARSNPQHYCEPKPAVDRREYLF